MFKAIIEICQWLDGSVAWPRWAFYILFFTAFVQCCALAALGLYLWITTRLEAEDNHD